MSAGGKASRLRGRLSINPDEVPAPTARSSAVAPVVTTVSTAGEPAVAAPEQEPEPTAQAPVRIVAPTSQPKPAKETTRPKAGEPMGALDDPTILAGRRDYRSFYVEDTAFARFRAAIYWLSRREDAVGAVPENMSVAIESFMTATAEDLEKRYNDGRPFRVPPGQRRRRARSEK